MSQVSPCRRALPAFLAVFALAGGCSWQDAPEDSGMHVTAEVHEVHYCSKSSPEITIANPPQDTDYYEVRLERLGEGGMFMGGGTWRFDGVAEDGMDSIPEGALTSSYRGPCPKKGESAQYMFTVAARRSGSAEPLKTATYVFTVEKP